MRRRVHLRLVGKLSLLLTLLILSTSCDLPVSGRHYTSAGSGVDPFANVRAKADQYYQAGLTAERNGDWKTALQDFRQASQWDHDGRQDIADALSRAEAQADWQTYRQASSSTGAPPATSSPSASASTTPAPAASAPAPSTSAAPPLKRFDSKNFPYSIGFPQDWVEEPGGTSELPADTFLGTSGPNSGSLVMITVEPAAFGITLDQFLVATENGLKSQGINDVRIYARRQVAGVPAYVLNYLDSTKAGTLSVRHAIFVTPGKAWHVILLASPAVTAQLDATFNAMLDSFQFATSAFPSQ